MKKPEEEAITEEAVTAEGLKVSEESSEKQVDLILAYYDLSPEDIAIEQGPEAMQTIMNGLVKAVMHGRLEISLENGRLSVMQHLKQTSEKATITKLTYGVVNGEAMTATEKVKGEHSKRHAFAAALTKTPEAQIRQLKGADFGTMRRLVDLFSVA